MTRPTTTAMGRRKWICGCVVASAVAILCGAINALGAEPRLLLHKPAVSASQIAFEYAADLWIVARAGGDARRLTAGAGLKCDPVFSPDGKSLAFAADYDGDLEVYVMPAAGGVPRRLTHHPDPDVPVSWTPDGKRIVFRSTRSSYAEFFRLFSVPSGGGQPTELPLPMAEEGSLSTDGTRIAYVPFSNKPPVLGLWQAVRNYRGGTASPLWIANLADSSIIKVERAKENEFNPMWVGDTIYFLSDRDGSTTLFARDVAGKRLRRLVDPQSEEIKSASACADAIVFDRAGTVNLFDLKSQKSTPVTIRVAADLPAVRPKIEKVAKSIQRAQLSPTGARAVFEARGEILTVPAEKGEIRNLTNTVGSAERDPSWSPDGKWIAYFSDESGEYELCIRAPDGRGKVKKLKVGDANSFFYTPTWSPDCKRIACSDKRTNLWIVDIETGKSTLVDTAPYDSIPIVGPASWSPDSQWLAYSRELKSQFNAVFLYSLKSGKSHQITDGMSDSISVAFDKGGKYLYFAASTDRGPSIGSGMSVLSHPFTRAVYAIVLSKHDPSPLAPQSDDEKEKKEFEKEKNQNARETPKTNVDFDSIDRRTLPLPIPSRRYTSLYAGKPGTLFLGAVPEYVSLDDPNYPGGWTLHRFDLSKRKTEKLVEGSSRFAVSYDGDKVLYRQGDGWFLVGTARPARPGEGALNLDALEVRVDPRSEWRQIYWEVYRIERDFFYDPHFHGYDLKRAWTEHAPFVEGLGSRYDLNYLLDDLLSGLSVLHLWLEGGDVPKAEGPRSGLLGADFHVANGRHRISKIYRGESWNPRLRAPLTEPGANIDEGEYLLAVNGQELHGDDEVYRLFENTAGKQTIIRVGPSPDGKGSREVTVVPIESETILRNLSWVDANRRAVHKATGGRVAYVYLPDTGNQGYLRFNRDFFAQAGRDAVIVDERFNRGGLLADYVIDYLRQPIRSYATNREGADEAFPPSAIPGPKVMLINEMAMSGGDYLPYAFRQSGLGPLVGKRTWGGLVSIGRGPMLIDGGMVTAPHSAKWFPNGRWDVENRGVAPDVEVELDPKGVRAGKDPQLAKAIEIVLGELAKHPVTHPAHPPYPNYYKPGLKEPAEGR